MIDIDHLRELRRKGPDGWWSAEAFGPGQNRIYAHDSDWALPWVAGAVFTGKDAEYTFHGCLICKGIWREGDPVGHVRGCPVAEYLRVMEEQR